jgi:hypothetical protein
MAIYKLYPYKDATLYSFYPDSNTGLDSILETGCPLTIQGTSGVFRFVVAFDQTEINNVFQNHISNSLWQSNLRCYIANAEGVSFSSKVFVHPTSGSWDNGTGQFGDNPITSDGVSWNWRNYISGSGWEISGLNSYVTASFLNTNKGGGVWYTGSSNTSLNFNPSQSFDIRSDKDLNINVTDIVKAWYSSSNSIGSDTLISNNGFIVKFDDNTEFLSLTSIQPDLKYFSIDTHTIYPPELEFKWKDYNYAPGIAPIISNPQVYASVTENPGFFYPDSVNRFRINCRPQYPTRVYQTSSINTNNYYLPSSSYYAIKDLDTNEYVIDFDTTYTQISADGSSNYFDIYMNGLQPERYYKILIKTTINNTTLILDNDYYFKIINS